MPTYNINPIRNTNTTKTFSSQSNSTIVNVLGNNIELYMSSETILFIATLNTVGIKLYDEIKKLGATFEPKLKNLLDSELAKYNRENKIDKII